ncbi:hypothetical protein TNIN_326111 [Trichonephila inaurata madagascariensis]|uniref:Uncharacterized protein n=1 Tax=Trichonephila inaurata madagascariensis TaxID=2747483 RepID=A0A8X6I4Z1_9ARAC|nr:hypothetical protein TNIN_326111 [Trichonephila inaurata madagascariensis]
MTFLLRKKKQDLIELAVELGLIIEAGLTKLKIKELIVKSPDYVEVEVKVFFDIIVEECIRKEAEEKEEKLRRKTKVSEREDKVRREERDFEFAK